MDSQTNKPNFISNVVLVSFVVGGVMGGLVGAVTGGISVDHIVPWFDRTFLGKEATVNNANTTSISTTKVSQAEEESATIDTVKGVSPSVGSIIVKQNIVQPNTDQLSPIDLFFGQQQPNTDSSSPREVAAGTGFIISSDGYILTNKHVININNAAYTFVTNEGNEYDAKLIATDPFNDIAVIKIEANDLPALELGDSDSLKIGQTVIAIGNTLSQFPNTVTKGIVSGIGRTITAGDSQGSSETLEQVIQTDAAINQGNSGGPLLTLDGKVVGINTAVSQEGQLLGFAIPISQVKPAIQSVRTDGKITRPYLGVRYQIITPESAEANNLSVDYGALIIRGSNNSVAVLPGSPADKAGLVENDIILEMNGQRITEDNSLSQMMKSRSVGDSVTLKYLHDGAEKTATTILEEYKAT
ncbi:MAG: trypsin-like peptidase domain-containing protein [Patescibacteria group bacterium]|jgi:serine protease Do